MLVLLGAALLYGAGLDYGLPHVLQPDEPISVNRALRFGSGDLNPHFFYYPSLLMYLYFLLFGTLFVAGHLAGAYPDAQAFARAFVADGTTLYLVARSVSVAALLAGLLLLYRSARGKGGLLAALALFALPQVVEYAHWAKADAPLLGLSAAAVWALLRLLERGRRRDYLVAAALIGAAAGMKYNGLFLVPGLPLAHLLRCRGSGRGWRCLFDRPFLLACLAVPAAFLCTTPFALLDWPTFSHDFAEQAGINVGGVKGQREGAARAALLFARFEGSYLWGALTFLSLLSALRRRQPADLLLAGLWAAGALAMSAQGIVSTRYFFPLYPAWALLVGRWAARWDDDGAPRALRRAGPALVLLSCLLLLPRSVETAARFTRTDTRVAARTWAEEHLDEGAKIALDSSGPPLEMTRAALEGLLLRTEEAGHLKSDYYRLKLETWRGPGFDWYMTRQPYMITPPDLAAYSRLAQRLFPIEEGYEGLLREGFRYAIISDWDYGAYLTERRRKEFPEAARFYRDVVERGTLLARFSPSGKGFAGPEVSIFAVGPGGLPGSRPSLATEPRAVVVSPP